MNYRYSNLDEYTSACQQSALYGDETLANVEYKERFWYTLDRFPYDYGKKKKQQRMYAKTDVTTGHRLFTLRELADADGRIFRHYVSEDPRRLNDYLDNNYYFLFVDIDDLPGFKEKALATYKDLVDLVAEFQSPEFPEVYVRKSTSTEEKEWKCHFYVRCRNPYYYRVAVGGGMHRQERENSMVLPEYKMTEKFIKTFIEAFPKYFQTHQFAKIDTALYSIHQCIQTAPAPATEVCRVTKSVLPDTVIAAIPTMGTKKDIYFGVPDEFRNPKPYPCTASMRYKAWGITLLPRSFDPRLPSLKVHSDYRVGDGLRHRFACKLARDLWVAVHFNLAFYPEYAEPYDAERFYRWVMSEVYIGAYMETANENSIKASVRRTIARMDADTRSVEQIIEDDYADSVKYDEAGKMISDPYMIRHLYRTSHEHFFWALDKLSKAGLLGYNRTIQANGSELKKILDELHISRQTLKAHGMRFKKIRAKKTRSDKGRKRQTHSIWDVFLSLCKRDVDGRVIVPKDVADLDRFRQYCSRRRIRYVSSSLACDDPLDIDCVTDMPTPDAWLAPWMPEDEVEWVA